MSRIVAILLIAALSAPAAHADQLFQIDSERGRAIYRWYSYSPELGQIEHEEVMPLKGHFRYTENHTDYIMPTVTLRSLQVPYVRASAHPINDFSVVTPSWFYFPTLLMQLEESGDFQGNADPCNSFNWARERNGTCMSGSSYGWDRGAGSRDGDLIEFRGDQRTAYLTQYHFEVYAKAIDRVPGDANGDDYVTALDQDIQRVNYGATGATLTQGDFNGDGLVNAADYTVWRDHHYNPFSEGAAAAAPEPSSMLLTLIGFVAANYRRRPPQAH